MPEYFDHYWVGQPAAVVAALDTLGWKPLLGLASPVEPPVVAWGQFTEETIAGVNLGIALFRASQQITPPAGVTNEPGRIPLASVGVFAALDPIPQVITNAQGMAALRETYLPQHNGTSLHSVITDYIRQSEGGTRELAEDNPTRLGVDMLRIAWDQTNEWKRNGDTVQSLARLFGLDETAMDALFILAASKEL